MTPWRGASLDAAMAFAGMLLIVFGWRAVGGLVG
jgi:hypothetical protein